MFLVSFSAAFLLHVFYDHLSFVALRLISELGDGSKGGAHDMFSRAIHGFATREFSRRRYVNMWVRIDRWWVVGFRWR